MTADPPTEQVDHAEHAAGMRDLQDRRRPGRLRQVSPTLIELLRSKPDANLPGGEDEHPVPAVTGILLWSVVGLAMWAGLFWLVRLALR
jgi:hypothetical protein